MNGTFVFVLLSLAVPAAIQPIHTNAATIPSQNHTRIAQHAVSTSVHSPKSDTSHSMVYKPGEKLHVDDLVYRAQKDSLQVGPPLFRPQVDKIQVYTLSDKSALNIKPLVTKKM